MSQAWVWNQGSGGSIKIAPSTVHFRLYPSSSLCIHKAAGFLFHFLRHRRKGVVLFFLHRLALIRRVRYCISFLSWCPRHLDFGCASPFFIALHCHSPSLETQRCMRSARVVSLLSLILCPVLWVAIWSLFCNESWVWLLWVPSE